MRAGWRLLPFMLIGAGAQYLGATRTDLFFSDGNLTINAGLGAKVESAPLGTHGLRLGLRLDARAHLRPQVLSTWPTVEWEALAGVYVHLRPPVAPPAQAVVYVGQPAPPPAAALRPTPVAERPQPPAVDPQPSVVTTSPPPAPLPRGPVICEAAPVTVSKDEQVQLNSPLYFKTLTATLNPCSEKALDALARYLKQQRSPVLYIEGHASPDGSKLNERLSLERAKAAATYLLSQMEPGGARESAPEIKDQERLRKKLETASESGRRFTWIKFEGFGERCRLPGPVLELSQRVEFWHKPPPPSSCRPNAIPGR